MDVVNIKCPNCGSTFVKKINGQYICESCGSKFSVKEENQSSEMDEKLDAINENLDKIANNMASGGVDKVANLRNSFDGIDRNFYVARPELKKDQVFRQLLIDYAKNDECGVENLDDFSLESIKEEQITVLEIAGDVAVNYHAYSGRIVRDANGNSRTDWRPINGFDNYFEKSYGIASRNRYADLYYKMDKSLTYKCLSMDEFVLKAITGCDGIKEAQGEMMFDTSTYNRQSVEEVSLGLKSAASRECERHLSGRIKDFHSTERVTVQSVNAYQTTLYEGMMPKTKDVKWWCLPLHGAFKVFFDAKQYNKSLNKESPLEDFKNKHLSEVKKQFSGKIALSVIMIILSVLILIGGAVIAGMLPDIQTVGFIMIIAGIVALIVGIILACVFNSKKRKTLANLVEEEMKPVRQHKVSYVKKMISMLGMEDLSNDEIATILHTK